MYSFVTCCWKLGDKRNSSTCITVSGPNIHNYYLCLKASRDWEELYVNKGFKINTGLQIVYCFLNVWTVLHTQVITGSSLHVVHVLSFAYLSKIFFLSIWGSKLFQLILFKYFGLVYFIPCIILPVFFFLVCIWHRSGLFSVNCFPLV